MFFIDEIHRVNTTVEEYLYSAMEDFKIDILIDSGPNARTVRIDLEPFTLVGATTRLEIFLHQCEIDLVQFLDWIFTKKTKFLKY